MIRKGNPSRLVTQSPAGGRAVYWLVIAMHLTSVHRRSATCQRSISGERGFREGKGIFITINPFLSCKICGGGECYSPIFARTADCFSF